MLKFALLPLLFFCAAVLLKGQVGGRLMGQVFDAYAQEPMMFASVMLFRGDELITGAEADLDGNYSINNLPAGIYTIKASYVGMPDIVAKEIRITNGDARVMNFAWGEDGITLPQASQQQSPRSQLLFHFED